MNRTDVIGKLKSLEPALRLRGVGALYLFGSFARDEGRSDSDVDVFIDPANEEAYRFENFMGGARHTAGGHGWTRGLRHSSRALQACSRRHRKRGRARVLRAASKAPANRLRHTLDEARAIEQTARDTTFERFRDTWLIRRAVEHGLLIITEAAKTLPQELKATQPAIPWRQIESFGNLLRHEYREVDPAALWRIVHEELPRVVAAAQAMLDELDR
jgi:uncharacterized protein with HEPN domain